VDGHDEGNEPETPEPPRPPARPWCLFRCGKVPYAVGLEAVAEVVEVDRLVGLPLSPPRVLGLCALRREVIPVVGLDRGPAGPAGRVLVLILRGARGIWGVRIDAEGTAVAEEPLDPSVPGPDGSGATFLGTVRRDGPAHAAIDPEATWRSVREGVEQWYGSPPAREPAVV
jgi:purine-binding chemotaxis protein CheW